MTTSGITVDADGHVLEPRDVWQKYMEPGLRDRAIRIESDDDGVALEYMIALCNELEADPWFCIPHTATDEYVREFAKQVKATSSRTSSSAPCTWK